MTFLLITHVLHRKANEQFFAYAPYVREMNLWGKSVGKIQILAPFSSDSPTEIDTAYQHQNIDFQEVAAFSLGNWTNILHSIRTVPRIFVSILSAMRQADHIHLRCPGNMGLLGCIAQIFFPKKPKTAKYAGNWDWNSPQPWSYRLQQKILRNTFLTRNMTALVYGDWPDKTRNILPFFTASYHQHEAQKTASRPLHSHGPIRLIFVGTLSENKRPTIAIETAMLLKNKGLNIRLDLFGEGPERTNLAQKIQQHSLQNDVQLHGNVSAEVLKKAYQSAHFLVFASRSEGWPKAVAEAMFWACLPLTTAVSCVPHMLGQGLRGDLVPPEPEAMAALVENYLSHPERYAEKCRAALEWSRQFTLDSLASEIEQIVAHGARLAPH